MNLCMILNVLSLMNFFKYASGECCNKFSAVSLLYMYMIKSYAMTTFEDPIIESL